MDQGKAQKVSISLPEGILDTVIADVGPEGKLSGWFQQAAIERLQARGKWPEGPEELDDLKLVREARADGIDVKAVLEKALTQLTTGASAG